MPRRPRKSRPSDEEWLRSWESGVYRRCLLFGHWADVDALFPRVGDAVSMAEFPILVRDARKKGGRMDEIVLSDETVKMCEKRSGEGCVSCVYILSDFKRNGKLTDYPGNYPVEAKIEHVRAEKEGTVA